MLIRDEKDGREFKTFYRLSFQCDLPGGGAVVVAEVLKENDGAAAGVEVAPVPPKENPEPALGPGFEGAAPPAEVPNENPPVLGVVEAVVVAAEPKLKLPGVLEFPPKPPNPPN